MTINLISLFFFFSFKQLIVCQHVGSINNLLLKIISATNSKKLLPSKNPLNTDLTAWKNIRVNKY